MVERYNDEPYSWRPALWNRVDENDADDVTTSGRVTSLGRPRRNVGTYEDGPARNRKFPIEGEEWYNCSLSNIHNKCREETLEQLLLKEKPKKPSPFSPPYMVVKVYNYRINKLL